MSSEEGSDVEVRPHMWLWGETCPRCNVPAATPYPSVMSTLSVTPVPRAPATKDSSSPLVRSVWVLIVLPHWIWAAKYQHILK